MAASIGGLTVEATTLGATIFPREACEGWPGQKLAHREAIILFLRGGLIGMALLCQFEVVIITFTTFKRFSSLYCWSIISAAIGACLVTLGTTLSFFIRRSTWPGAILLNVGYFVYIPAEFAMIYSRLHLLLPGPRIIRFVTMIFVTEVVFVEIPMDLVQIIALDTSLRTKLIGVAIWCGSIEIVLYTATFVAATSFYLYLACKIFQSGANARVRSILMRLFGASTLLLIADGVNLGLYFGGALALELFWVPFLYSFKLLVEFWILNQLRELSSTTLQVANGHTSVGHIS